MHRRHLLRVFYGELEIVFVTAYRLVLSAVIHIYALDVLHRRSQRYISDKYQHTDKAFEEIHSYLHADVSLRVYLEKAYQTRSDELRQKEKQADGKRYSDDDRYRHYNAEHVDFKGFCKPLFRFRRLRLTVEHLTRTHESTDARYHRAEETENASQKRSAEKKTFFLCGLKVLTFYDDIAVFVAHRSRHTALAAHHDAFYYRLSAYRDALLSHRIASV